MEPVLPLVAILVAAIPSIDVVVLSRHRPQALHIEGRCRHQRRSSIHYVRRDGATVVACRAPDRDCLRTENTIELVCPTPPRLRVNNVAPRTYGRRFLIGQRDGALRIIATLAMDAYLSGVVTAELAGAPPAAERAQIVVARTYALHARAAPRHDDASVCDLTHCQVFAGRGSVAMRARVRRTPGQLTDDSDGPAQVFFHSTCGGQTLDARAVWSGASPAVVGVEDRRANGDAWCAASRHAHWVADVHERRLARALTPVVGATLHPGSLALRAEDEQGLRWIISDRDGRHAMNGPTLHRHLGRQLGWSTVKSSVFEALRAGETFRLRGRGLGHRVGLCQTGAIARARAGQSAAEILTAYFPKLRWTP